MAAVPAATPVTTPVDELTVATAVLLLLHVPPVVASVNVAVFPTHALMVPPIAAGLAFTDAILVAVPHVLVTV